MWYWTELSLLFGTGVVPPSVYVSGSSATILIAEAALAAGNHAKPGALNILVLVIFSILMYAGVICYPLIQLWALWRLRGRQRLLAAAALVVMIPIYIISGIAYKQQSNLWPIWMILLSPVATIYVAAILRSSRTKVKGK